MSTDAPLPSPHARACWCGDERQFAYSEDYNACRVCGTLITRAAAKPEVFRVGRDADELYSKEYWLNRQSDKYGLPPIQQRARLDLPERCVHWLRRLLKHKLPGPGTKTLELGCAHGGYVALMTWAGYEASGTEMSPWVVEFARQTFGIDVFAGPVEQQTQWSPGTFDAIILNDVVEHLPDPLGTLATAARLLKPDGVFFLQTPEYKEHLSYQQLVQNRDRFRVHLDGKNDEHLFLYSRRSTQLLWRRLGFTHVFFDQPIFDYDLFYVASRVPLTEHPPQEIDAALMRSAGGRLVLALLDKAFESQDRWWAIQRLEQQANHGSKNEA